MINKVFNNINVVASSFLLATTVNAQTIELKEGWNLVGISEKSSSMLISNFLSSDNLEMIYTVVNGASKTYSTTAPFTGAPTSLYQAFNSFEAGQGYWIKAKQDYSFELNGDISSIKDINAGWNLVSIPSSDSVDSYISNVLYPAGYDIDMIYTVVDGASKTYSTTAPFAGAPASLYQAFSNFNASQGYWLKVSKRVDYLEDESKDLKISLFNSEDNSIAPTISTANYSDTNKQIDILGLSNFSGSLDISKYLDNTTLCDSPISITNIDIMTIKFEDSGDCKISTALYPPAFPSAEDEGVSLGSFSIGSGENLKPLTVNSDSTISYSNTLTSSDLTQFNFEFSDVAQANQIAVNSAKSLTLGIKIEKFNNSKKLLVIFKNNQLYRDVNSNYIATKSNNIEDLEVLGVNSNGDFIVGNSSADIEAKNAFDKSMIIEDNSKISIDIEQTLKAISGSSNFDLSLSDFQDSGDYSITFAISGLDAITTDNEVVALDKYSVIVDGIGGEDNQLAIQSANFIEDKTFGYSGTITIE